MDTFWILVFRLQVHFYAQKGAIPRSDAPILRIGLR